MPRIPGTMHSQPRLNRTVMIAFLAATSLLARGQGMHAVPGSPGWTQQLIQEAKEGPLLALSVIPTIESATVRKGYEILLHQDNDLWSHIRPRGKQPIAFKLPPNHLYTLEVRHEAAYRKVIQIDTDKLDRFIALDCAIDLILKPELDSLSFEDELVLSSPLSVVWFDSKRNLFRHDAYLHGDGIERLRSHLSLRDPSWHDPPSREACTKPPDEGAAGQHR